MAELAALLSKIDNLAEQVEAVRPLDYETEQKVRQKLWLDWNYHSNAIEGNTLSLGETRAFLLHGITAQGKPFRDYIDIDGHRKAIEYLEKFIRQDEELTEAYIRELHRVLLVERYQTDALTADGRPTKRWVEVGQYKTVPNSVRTSTGAMHFYASPEETPARMGDLMVWYRDVTSKGAIHPVVLAASFHFRFVEIHPFDDGNGRMSRLLMNLMLMRHGLVPIIVPTDRKPEYILTLEQADAGEIEPFIEFIGERVVESLELYLRAARGESIEDLSDIDKRIALLEKEIANSGETSQHIHSIEVQQNLYLSFIVPLLTRLTQQIQKLDRFFKRKKSFIIYGDNLRPVSLPGTIIGNRTNIESNFLNVIIDQIRMRYMLSGLNNNPDAELIFEISILFKNDHYILKVDGDSLRSSELRFTYEIMPDSDEINSIVYDISSTLLAEIEQKLKKI